MFRPPNPSFTGSSPNSRYNKSYTFPSIGNSINTIDEDSEDFDVLEPPKPPSFSTNSFHERVASLSPTNNNPFEKSFQSIHLSKVSSIDSNVTLVDKPVMPQHNKTDSRSSIGSMETLSSYRLKRFNSTNSIPLLSESSSTPTVATMSTFKKAVKFPVHGSVGLMANDELSGLFDQGNKDVLIIDVRPFIDFNKSHVKGSINFNLPSTLLKRSNFTLQKCFNNLSLSENILLKKFLSENSSNKTKKIIVYDDSAVQNNEVSLGIHGTLNKFIQYEQYHGELYVLKNGFQKLAKEFSALVSHSTSDEEPTVSPCSPSSFTGSPLPQKPSQQTHHYHSLSNSSIKSMPQLASRSISLASLSTSSLSSSTESFTMHSASASFSNPTSSSPNSPNLSRFQLPILPKTPVFKIRHNEESYDLHSYRPVLNEFKFLNTPPKSERLPNWLTKLLLSNEGASDRHSSLIEKFKTLEIEEKKRINDMISNNSIGCGIELGWKNRYKDIFPYEHSRVKLSVTPTSERTLEDVSSKNYINANFISCPSLSNFKYIATQAPLLSTLSDFNKLIKDNNIEIVIALTNQFENGVEKCYPYWDEKSMYKLIEEQELDNIIIRRLKVKDCDLGREIIQIQITNWQDYDIMANSQQGDVLKLVFFKRMIMEKLNIWNENVLVHCSAGCGRTGTFCTLDTIINIEDGTDSSFGEIYDPVFCVVEKFRDQRISMVQNLRQYLFIYDCLCNYFENFQQFEQFHNDFKDLKIVDNFIAERLVASERGGSL